MPFSSTQLAHRLEHLPQPKHYWLGFSGGLDSTALLVAAHELKDSLPCDFTAIHIDHGLHADTAQWVQHCQNLCEQLAIPLIVEKIHIQQSPRESLEALAREQRYQAISKHMQHQHMLLTAHHMDDQAETLLLNLMRGSSVDGLAAMADYRDYATGWLGRPLLPFSRQDLTEYVQSRNISWLDDPSNQDTSLNRNYLRHQVLPLLQQRWPAARQMIARSADHLREVANHLQTEQHEKLQAAINPDNGLKLNPMSDTESSLLIRHWLKQLQAPPLPKKKTENLISQLRTVDTESKLTIEWEGWMIRYFRGQLWAFPDTLVQVCRDTLWTSGQQIDLGACGQLLLHGAEPDSNWAITSRPQGGSFKPQGHQHSKTIKQLLQESAIPPWLRDSLPFLFWGDELMAIGDFFLHQKLVDWLTQHQAQLTWQNPLHQAGLPELAN